LIDKLSVRTPTGEVKLKVMKEIAKEFQIQWDTTESEMELLKPPEERIVGSSLSLSLSRAHTHSHTQFDKFVFLRILVLSLIRKDLALLLVLPAYPCSLSQLNLLSQISQLLGMLSNLFTGL